MKRIRNLLKRSFDRFRNQRIKQNFLQAVPYWVASIITGLIAVLYARLFALAERGTSWVFHYHGWILLIMTPVCFLLSWWVVTRFSPYAKGSGIPQVIAAIELATPKHNEKVNQLLSIRIIVVKIMSSMVLVFGGGITGREGPTIQIAGSVFRKVNQWLPDWWPKISKRNMIMAGAAAGLAAAFNTPLGGIVFAVEELTRTHISYFKTALFSAVIIAGLTAQGFLGPYLYLGYPNVTGYSSWMFAGVILVAILSGLGGSGMSVIILRLIRWKATFNKKEHIFYIVAAALIIAGIALTADEKILGSGKELMTTALFTSQKYTSWYTPVFKTAGLIFTFSMGGAGGVFAPALSIGAAIGSVLSGWMHLAPVNSNLLILCGMVGFLTGVTRSPFTSAILVLEMTDRHNLIFHLMLAGMVAGMVSIIMDKHSFYDRLKDQYEHELLAEAPLNTSSPEIGKESAVDKNEDEVKLDANT